MFHKIYRLFFCLLVFSSASVYAEYTEYTKDTKQGSVIAINKITAKSEEIILNVNESKYFGNVAIKLNRCIQVSDPYALDDKMLLTITEYKADEDSKVIFHGWMLSSSISISTLEHSVYEVFSKKCF